MNKLKLCITCTIWTLAGSIIGFLGCLNNIAYQFSGTITQALCGDGANVNTEELETAIQAGTDLAIEISNQGVTMLRNENNVLPLTNNKVNVFGYGSSDIGQCFMGYGSGGAGTNGRIYFYGALRDVGFEINENLASAYNSITEFTPETKYGGGNAGSYKLYEPELSFFDQSVGNGKTLISDAKEFSDTAIVVITRRGSEDQDWPQYSYDQNKNIIQDVLYSELSTKERELMQFVKSNFSKVVAVINSPNVIELGFLEEYEIDGCLSMYLPGNKGNMGVANILKGIVNPSGKTVDTWPYDVSTAASYYNAGPSGTHRRSEGTYVDYMEDIYTGYYWYETADAEGFWTSDYAKQKWNVNGYGDVVMYPFGFGLSYTTFEWEIKNISVTEKSSITKDSEFAIDVLVTNTGSIAGRDVVELYYQPKYIKGQIEKSSERLVAFAKTTLLEPNASELMHLTFTAYDLVSYDCYDKNFNGNIGYEIDAGEFTVTLKTDAHKAKQMKPGTHDAVIKYNVKTTILIENDPVTGYPVTNKLTNFTNSTSGASSIHLEPSVDETVPIYSIDGSDIPGGVTPHYMSRDNFISTFPTFEAMRSDITLYALTKNGLTPRNYATDEMPVTGSTSTNYKITDMIQEKYDDEGNQVFDENDNPVYELVDYNDQAWDDLVSQLDTATLFNLSNSGGFGTIAIPSIEKERTVDSDGPCGFNAIITGNGESKPSTSFPCEVVLASTWNWMLSYQMGLSVGAEGKACGKSGWYAPACNLHRSTLGGRNYEYYSEDPYLSGIMTAYSVYGAKEKSVYSYVKHFVANDDEYGRTGKYTWMTEQSLRENYLKPFEISVKVGKATGMMSGFNRVGSVRVGGSYAINTEILRNEWGFKGTVISDYYQGGNINDMDESIRAGANLCLSPNNTIDRFNDRTSATAVKAIKEAAKGILYTYIEAKYVAMTASGLSLGSYTGMTSVIYPWWIPLLATLDAIVVSICVIWAVDAGISAFRKPSHKKKTE